MGESSSGLPSGKNSSPKPGPTITAVEVGNVAGSPR